jgi:hypothetical protein
LKFFAKTVGVPDADFQILYDGDALRTGSMDVRDLAPALLALGDLCERANALLNGEDIKVALNIHADFRRGSFQVHAALVQLHQTASIAASLFPDSLKSAKDILELLFGGGVVVRVVELIKMLRGKAIPEGKIAAEGGTIIDFSGADLRNSTVIVSPNTAKVYSDTVARRSLAKVLKPLESDGIDEFEVHEAGRLIQKITRDEVPYFESSTSLALPDDYEGDREGNFLIVTASFEGRYKWRLFDGHARFTADIADRKFLERVDAGEKFGKGDVLVGTLHIKQWRDDHGLHAEYKITHVADVIPTPRQMRLG